MDHRLITKTCCQPKRHMHISKKSKLFLLSVCCAVLTLVILSSAPWRTFSTYNEQNEPYTSAKLDSLDSTERKHSLVDAPQLYSDIGPVYNISETKRKTVILKILWFNKPIWFGEEQEVCNININRCFYDNCLVTYNSSLLKEVDAIIFDATASNFPQNPPLPPQERDPNQVWIFYGLESPFHYNTKQFQRSQWRSMFNWTMTYRLDSDIPHPYGILLTNHYPPERNYRDIFRTKTKFAAWIVSNCNAVSRRNDFVRLLQTYVPVDIFGNCGTKNCNRKGTECRDSVGKDYKFYLSFENSLCRDYVTEKFFQYFPLDLITVQRGYSDYDALLPNDTFINSADFSTVKELAHFMTRLAEDEGKFIRYLKSKDGYVSKSHTWTYCNALCNICKKLNNREKYRKSYNDIFTWLEENTCSQASDVR